MDWNVTYPYILNYKPFYIQGAADARALDTRTEWGMVAKTNPLPLLPNPKAPYNNEWADHDGDDEYTTKMYYESFTFDVSFFIKTKSNSYGNAPKILRDQVRAFFSKVRNGTFRTFDTYTGVGYKTVRYNGYKEESYRSRDDWAKAVFTVTFKVIDPTAFTNLTSSGSGVTLTDAQ